MTSNPQLKFTTALRFTLKWEGGYVNHPADPGGATNRGITQRVFDDWRRSHQLSARDVRGITEAEVRTIYFTRYWKPARCEQMMKPLAVVQFDTAVNFGVAGAIMFLQEAIQANPVDGIWGPITEGRFLRNNDLGTAASIIDLRVKFRHQRVRENPSQKVFLQGWLNRDNDLLALIRNGAPF